jgi:colicin import membrane protein
MQRKPKTYQASLGFHDLAMPAPSMKAALEAWGAGRKKSFSSGCRQGERRSRSCCCDHVETWRRSQASRGINAPFTEAYRPADEVGWGWTHAQTKENPCESREQLRGRPTVQQPVRPHLRSRESSDGVKTSAGRKRPPGRNRTNDAARRKRRWKKREREHHKRVVPIEGARDALEKKLQAEDARRAEEKDELERALRGARIGPRRLCPLADVKRLGRPG